MNSATSAESREAEFHRAAAAAWREWDESPARLELVAHQENVVFRADSERGASFVLRLHRPGYHDLAELISEQHWTAALNVAGIGAPVPVRALDGRRYVEVPVGANESRLAGVSEWVDGEVLSDLVDEASGELLARSFDALGRIAARIHNQAVSWELPPQFTRHSFDVDGFLGEAPFWGRFWEVSGLDESDRRLTSEAREHLRGLFSDFGRDAENYSLIHGDLHPGNILKTENGLQVIDFDDAGFGWHLYELAVALFHYQPNPHFEMVRDALVAGYRSERRLSDEALDLLPAFLLMRALALLGWLEARPELGRRDAFEHVRRLARRQAAALLA
ncbi:MAG: phosphotransferase [Acidobacteria bacterium]|nr:phosphotransferase [Acidobacteriota bacterium]